MVNETKFSPNTDLHPPLLLFEKKKIDKNKKQKKINFENIFDERKVFGTTGFNPDGEMGPYPLDGEMGPYPLSDNTNLLSSSSYGMSLYRNYGSSYGTNYASSNIYTAKYSNKKPQHTTMAQPATSSNINNNSGYCNNADSYESCNHCGGGISGNGSATNTKCNTPVPTRRKRERDSFRRHSAYGRMSSSQGTHTPTHTHTKQINADLITQKFTRAFSHQISNQNKIMYTFSSVTQNRKSKM